MSSSIAVILVETEHVDNLGAVARAMKNMGLSDLRLVKPPAYWKRRSKKMAVNAYDVIQKATVYKNLKAAIHDQHIVVALSRRHGSRRRDFVPFPQTIKVIEKKSKKWKVALVFGKESKGLANEDLILCDWMTTIPSSPQYASLNLAQAVMVVVFSIFQRSRTKGGDDLISGDAKVMLKNTQEAPFLRVTKNEIREVLAQVEKSLIALGYPEEGDDVVDRVQATFYRLFNRAGLLESEAKMLKGLTRRIIEQKRERSKLTP